MAYRIEYSPECEDHFRALTARDRAVVLDAVVEQLAHQPTVETRHRKRMRPNPLAPRELRIGDLRVYYDVEDGPEPVVHIRAIGARTMAYSGWKGGNSHYENRRYPQGDQPTG